MKDNISQAAVFCLLLLLWSFSGGGKLLPQPPPPPQPPSQPSLSPEQAELLRRKEQEEGEALRRFQEESQRFVGPLKLEIEPKKEVRPPKTRKKMKKSKKTKKCTLIYNIYITGDPDLSKGDAHELVKDWQGYCLGKPEFTALLREITEYYTQKAYVSTRAYLLPQDLKSGELQVKVVPGIITNIRFAEGQGYASEIFTAFPFFTGRRLYLRSLEQGLERLNSLSSNRAKLDIQETQPDGSTDIIIQNPHEKIWRAGLTLDNSGSGLAGRETAAFNLEFDSPLLLNDYWNLNVQKNIKPVEPGNQNSSRSLQFRLPFGYLQASAFLSRFEYKSTVKTDLGQFQNRGNSNTQNLSLEATLHRSQQSKTLLGYSNKLRQSENFIDDVLLRVSSRSIRSGAYSLSHSRSFERGYMNLSLSHHKGKLSEVEGVSQAPFAPALRFEKTNLNLSYSLPFRYGKDRLSWKFAFQGQKSGHILFSGEQFGIGGLHSVRGFKEQSLSGDEGFYVRNELHWTPASLAQPTAWLLWGVPSFFLAYDIGTVEPNAENGPGAGLEGLALGFNHRSPHSQFSLVYGRSMRWAYLEREDALWLSLSLTY